MLNRDDWQEVVDPIAFVRSHPDWFFRSAKFDPAELIGHLVAEALRCGATTVQARFESGWWYVAADEWLGPDAEASFRRVISYPQGGANSMRAELLVSAFASDAGTAANGEWMPVTGSVPQDIEASALAFGRDGRVVVFR